MIDTSPIPEIAVLIGVINRDQNESQVAEYLEELAFLAKLQELK